MSQGGRGVRFWVDVYNVSLAGESDNIASKVKRCGPLFVAAFRATRIPYHIFELLSAKALISVTFWVKGGALIRRRALNRGGAYRNRANIKRTDSASTRTVQARGNRNYS